MVLDLATCFKELAADPAHTRILMNIQWWVVCVAYEVEIHEVSTHNLMVGRAHMHLALDISHVGWVISMARAFGDSGMKLKNLITSEPDVTVQALEQNDRFVVLASDGVWSKVSNSDAISAVRRCMCRGESPEDAARALTALAYDKFSTDNIAVVVAYVAR